jgi:hypothetical protein
MWLIYALDVAVVAELVWRDWENLAGNEAFRGTHSRMRSSASSVTHLMLVIFVPPATNGMR